MLKHYFRVVVVGLCLAILLVAPFPSVATRSSLVEDYKTQVAADVASMAKQSQVMVDMVFSFGELGFQEVETSKYLTGVLEKEGFKIERGVAGIPTAWIATWGSGKPVISRSAPTLIAFHKRHKSQALRITIRSSKAHPDTAKVTTPVCR